jgi:hypothetical protein
MPIAVSTPDATPFIYRAVSKTPQYAHCITQLPFGTTEEVGVKVYYSPYYSGVLTASDLIQSILPQTHINDAKYNALYNEYPLQNDLVDLTTHKILSYFHSKNISKYTLSAISEGGMGIDLVLNKVSYNITLYNDGVGTLYIKEPGNIPKGWDYSFEDLFFNVKSEFDGL